MIRKRTNAARFAICVACLMAVPLLAGCGDGGPRTVIVEGTVKCGGETVESGQIRFVPTGDTPGSTNVSEIVAGRYRVEARGGVPVGKYRVEITAEKKTGRQIIGDNGLEPAMVDETVSLAPPEYGGPKSTLTAEITPKSDGRLDFDLPKR